MWYVYYKETDLVRTIQGIPRSSPTLFTRTPISTFSMVTLVCEYALIISYLTKLSSTKEMRIEYDSWGRCDALSLRLGKQIWHGFFPLVNDSPRVIFLYCRGTGYSQSLARASIYGVNFSCQTRNGNLLLILMSNWIQIGGIKTRYSWVIQRVWSIECSLIVITFNMETRPKQSRTN